MKLIVDFNRRTNWKSGARVCCLVLALVAGGGCGKPKDTPPQVMPPPSSDSNSTAGKTITPPPVRTQPAPPPVSFSYDSNAKGVTQLQALNRALLGWKMKYNRRPHTFEEFASTAGFQIPAPPAGKKYTLSSKGFIVLVDSN